MADANRTTQTGPTESENRDRNAFQDDNTADTAGGAALEIDNDFLEQDSAYGTSSDNGSNFTSLNSSVTDYVFENGRRYHRYKEGKYFTPNDEQEMDREDMKHHWCKLVLSGKLHLAPLTNPTKILDIGTGTGIWCMEMSEEYPETQITGTDLSPIQPKWVAPNVTFEIDDWDDEWVYGENVFDLIHNRFNTTAVSDWRGQFAKAHRALKPSGCIELVDLMNPPQSDDNSIPANSQVMKFFELLTEGCTKVNRDLHSPLKWEAWLRDAGFVNVEKRVYKVPIGGWPKSKRMKEAGVFEMETLREGLPAIGMGFFTRVLGWRAEEVEVFFAGVRRELGNRNIHFWLPLHVMWAQKPGAA